MVKAGNNSKSFAKTVAVKAVKAAAKGAIFYLAYLVAWTFISPLSDLVPGLQQTIEAFVMVYFVLIIVGEFASGSIFQYFFSAAKILFVIGYMMYTLNGGVFGITIENVSLMVDLRLFMLIAVVLGLLGLAKTMLQAVSYMSEKAEPKLV
ncbi:MAG: hypothetical protein QHH24_06945 [Candidatus Bathyarchaeota archaeon]|nr:hypothetical protein [Candidatus Bathyarchaeota archaeon]